MKAENSSGVLLVATAPSLMRLSTNVRVRRDPPDLVGDLRHHLGGRAGRRQHALPGGHVEAGQASRRSPGRSGAAGVRLRLATPSARSLPVATLGQIDGMVSKIMSTWPPSSAVIAGALPVIGHVHDVGPGGELEQLGGEMRRAAVTRARIGELARIGLHHLDQLLDAGGREIAAHHQDVGKGGDQRDRRRSR